MVGWRRRLKWWARQNRIGLWAAVCVALAALAYGLVYFTEKSSVYQPLGYEPKDIERQRFLERTGEAGPGERGAADRPAR